MKESLVTIGLMLHTLRSSTDVIEN